MDGIAASEFTQPNVTQLHHTGLDNSLVDVEFNSFFFLETLLIAELSLPSALKDYRPFYRRHLWNNKYKQY